ncbi:hypothetical protein Micbo1qcDRAFT_158940 [Microdochium bolleyi]|uniref:CFEM domain-containing protein n=1 Tax=Microdochium bolleyi TaxID=196109 RepID=A0A136JA37_9PEZI|nr:hypothetical protein Micbo1qcDRAFT_158940 [Microdochium bolleyi]
MRSALILALASTAVAQFFPNQPSCAIPCLSTAITQAGCQPTDISCQCGDKKGAIGAAAAGCLLSACNLNEVQQAQSAGNAVCSSFSAGQLSSIPATGSASSTRSGSASATPTGSAGTTSSAASTGSGSSSASATASSTRSSVSVSISASTTSIATTNSQGQSTTIVSTTSRPVSVPTGAAATAGPMMGAGIIAGVLGAVVAF